MKSGEGRAEKEPGDHALNGFAAGTLAEISLLIDKKEVRILKRNFLRIKLYNASKVSNTNLDLLSDSYNHFIF